MRLHPRFRATMISLGFALLASSAMAAENSQDAKPANGNWKFGIGSRFRWEDSNQPHVPGFQQFSSIRLRPNFTFTGIEGLRIFIEPQYNKVLGNPSGETETSGNSGYSGTIDNLNLYNGYMDLRVLEDLNLIAGRQVLSYGDQLIIGNADWGVYGRTFDAIRLQYKPKDFAIDLFQAKIVETTAPSPGPGAGPGNDKDLVGLYASYSPSQTVRAIDLYGFYLNDARKQDTAPADATRPWDFGVYGSRVVTDFGNWAWRIEYAQNFGKENTSALTSNSNNHTVDTQADYRFGNSEKHTLGLQLFTSGPHWRDLYPSTNGQMGRADVLGRRNLTGAALRWNTAWSTNWVTALDLFAFTRTDEGQPVFKTDSKTAIASTSSSKDVGYEIDLNIKKALNPNLSLGAGIDVFMYGPHLEQRGNGQTFHYGYFMIEARH